MKLEILYPELSGLFGDAMNPEFILRAVPDAEAVRTSIKTPPAFAGGGADIVYLGSMTEKAQELCCNALLPYKEHIISQIDAGTIFLITGNAMELFGRYIETDDGSRIPMLGIFDYYAKRRMLNRYNSLYLGKFGDIDIVGFKSQFSHIYTDTENGADGSESAFIPYGELFETVRGAGRKPGVKPEGVRRNNFMAAYVLGPLLVLNPLFTKSLLEGFPGCEIPFESAAMEAYQQRLREFQDPVTVESF